ncbi:hypothetical protein D1871_11455 [Nakamurella silvestris]|nr:hypothetical protein D1871_11455 [Nakamurella silvestris]
MNHLRRATTSVITLALLGGLLFGGTAAASETTGGSAARPDPTAATAALAPLATAPGSIVYIKDHNIWIANGDASVRRAVTTDGRAGAGYGSPSMSDAGVIAAAKGATIVRMKQDGTVLNRMDPPALVNRNGVALDGTPADVAIAPNGALIAYTFVDPSCSPVGPYCWANGVTAYTAADRLTAAAQYGVSYFQNPSWVNNRRTLQDGGFDWQLNFHDIPNDVFNFWFADRDMFEDPSYLSDAVISRDGTLMAAVRGVGDGRHFQWYEMVGDPAEGTPQMPTPICYTDQNAGYAGPTFAPDSSALATQEPEGIWIKPLPRDCTYPSALKIPGGTEPFWSAATLQTPVKTFSVTRASSVSGTPKAGSTLTATTGSWTPAATTYRYQWKADGKAIAGATGRTFTVRTADRGRLITVTVTGSRSGYTTKAVASAGVRINKDFAVAKLPAVSGNPKAGKVLSASVGRWSPAPTKYRYQWKRDGRAITGATSKNYQVKSNDRGHTVTVTVTGSRTGYTTRAVTAKTVRIAK